MKPSFSYHVHRSRRGSALLIVLAMLLLLTPLVLAILFRTGSSVASSNNFSNQTSARILAQTAVNLVISQIRLGATTFPSGGAGPLTWISQPGLIQTFNNSGNPVMAYKLYSSNLMTVPESASNPFPVTGAGSDAAALTSDKWSTQPNLYTDLNSPVTVTASGAPTLVFPIVDGNNMNLTTQINGEALLTYSTNSGGVPDIEGFGIYPKDPNYQVPNTAGTGVTAANTPVPMPVKWLYMLQDGTLLPATVASGGSGKDVTVTGTDAKGNPVPSATNPIIARVAFWTDDESSKINLNTAGEGTYWDSPVCVTQPPGGEASAPPLTDAYDPQNIYEYDLAGRPPVANESQSLPGHPATTCLSAVFGASIRDANGLPSGTQDLTGAQRGTFVEKLDEISPLYCDDNSPNIGSAGGSVSTYYKNSASSPITFTGNSFFKPGPSSGSPPLLYTDTDEAFFQPTMVNGSRVPRSLAGSPEKTAQLMAESRFFLTTSSSAPEVNVFGGPRVAIWPESTNTSTRTAFDKAIAFCSTLGGRGSSPEAYYFTRSNPSSATVDAGLDRNMSVYNYLNRVAGSNWPGYGGNFTSKYPSIAQVFTEIFDYIRCTNLIDQTPGATTYTTPVPITDSSNSKANSASNKSSPAMGQVVPIQIGSTRGFGRMATICELALVAVKVDTRELAQTNLPDAYYATDVPPRYNFEGKGTVLVGGQPTPPYANDSLVEFALVPMLFSPSAGFPALARDMKIVFSNSTITVKELDGNIANNSTLFTQTELANGAPYDDGHVLDGESTNMGGYIGPWALTNMGDTPTPSNVPSCIRQLVGLSAADAPFMKQKAGTITVSGSITCKIYAPNTNTSTPLQTFQFQFPTSTPSFPTPDLRLFNTLTNPNQDAHFGYYPAQYLPKTTSVPPVPGTVSTGNNVNTRWDDGDNPISIADTAKMIADGNDTIISLQASGPGVSGDIRMIAASALVPSTAFEIIPSNITLPNAYQSYGFYSDQPRTANWYPNTTWGWLVSALSSTNANLTTWAQQYAPLPAKIQGVVNANGQPGDWDNGPATVADGPYINKPDEGVSIGNMVPYIGTLWEASDSFGSIPAQIWNPARQIPSPVMFGSLSTGIPPGITGGVGKPWQTLLFRPAKNYFPGGDSHPGAAVPNPQDGSQVATYPPYSTPPDHCLLDLFWMPTVLPTPISQPFATSGKVNLNYQIAPFTYIKRSTAMRAVLKSVDITALNPNQKDHSAGDGGGSTSYNALFAKNYKVPGAYLDPNFTGADSSYGGGTGVSVRRMIDPDKTLQQFDDLYFANNHPFITESQICDVPLIPAQNTTNAGSPDVNVSLSGNAKSFDSGLASFWASNLLTGDNSLERPYVAIYPRVTTKSNVFTVHVRVQTLKKAAGPSSTYGTFRNGVDQVTGEYRGSFVVERYLDPNTAGWYDNGNPSSETDSQAAIGPYKFRILSTKQFNP